MKTINQKIVGYKVLSNNTGVDALVVTEDDIVVAGTPFIRVEPITKGTVLSRPEKLFGFTFKIKAPQLYTHGVFITLNYLHEDGLAIPFEIFFNTKNRELTAWLETVSLTITSLLRTRTSISHLLEEYRTIQDAKGGYRGKVKGWETKPKYYTSILGEVADVIEYFLELLEDMNEDRVAEELLTAFSTEAPATTHVNEASLEAMEYPASATICPNCGAKAVVLMDGCGVCLECSFSRCS
jgi:hypothetical protein